MRESKPILEKLYLDKREDGEICVPTYCENDPTKHLSQYQIDGIRFLYKQYKKNKPGVILNYPSGYGKTLQVVLFLLAIKHLRQKSILILCNEDDVNNWKNHFHQWADCYDIIEGRYPLARKAIYINSITNKPKCVNSKFGWDVVVVEHDSASITPVRINARYKIWLTSLDIRADKDMFLCIYRWFYQKSYLEYLGPMPVNDMKDKLEKSIRLDALLEDIVFGYNAKKNNSALFKKIKEEEFQEDALVVVPPRKTYVSKKNKDATGTKVKKSKKGLLNENISTASVGKSDPVEPDPNINVDTNVNKRYNNNFNINHEEIKGNNNVKVESNEWQNNDIESFIRNHKPITSEGFEHFMHDIDNSSQNSQECKTEIDELNTIYEEQNIRLQNSSNGVLVASNKNYDNSIGPSVTVYIENNIDINKDNYLNLKSLDDINDYTDVKQIPKVEIIEDHNEESEIAKVIVNIDDKSDVFNKRKINNKPVHTYNDIDDKFAEIEEIAVKKFKGSLLDTLFNK